jgi:hypothetical protein
MKCTSKEWLNKCNKKHNMISTIIISNNTKNKNNSVVILPENIHMEMIETINHSQQQTHNMNST